jgi:hypothetical protein
MHTGEPPECGKHSIPGSKVETGKFQRLPGCTGNDHRWMYMSAENKTVFPLTAVGLVMRKNEAAYLQLPWHQFDGCTAVPFMCQYIVIANHQFQLQGSMIVSPAQEKVHLLVGMTVKKITHDHQVIWFEELYLGRKSLQVFFEYGLRNGNAVLAEMTRLTKMQIGKYQCLFFFPKNATCGRKYKTVIEDAALDEIVHESCKDSTEDRYWILDTGCSSIL